MPDLDWDRFKELPGDATRNFELLCRGAIRRNHASKGHFQSVAQQPGVEFHLRLAEKCGELGEPPGWWGWQCRWYDLDAGRPIGITRQQRIIKAIETTEKWLPDMTDWVLWTRRALTPTDQKWFLEINTTMTLHLRTGEDDLPDLLGGDAAALRSTYFGQLVLTPTRLSKMRAEGVEAVKRRYDPAVHVKVEAEKVLEQFLGQPKSWGSLAMRATRLRQKAAQLHADQKPLDKTDARREPIGSLLDDAGVVEARLRAVVELLAKKGPEPAAALAAAPMDQTVRRADANRAMAALRARRQPAALGIHMLEAELRRARALIAGFARCVSVSMCTVVGDAGRGKSNLAIDLTAERADAPAGLYLQGRNLPKSGSLEDLLVPLISRPAGTFKDLLEALDAAGARAGRRVPVVIDGLTRLRIPRGSRSC